MIETACVHERHGQSRCLIFVGIGCEAEEASKSRILSAIVGPNIFRGAPYAKDAGSVAEASIHRASSLAAYF